MKITQNEKMTSILKKPNNEEAHDEDNLNYEDGPEK